MSQSGRPAFLAHCPQILPELFYRWSCDGFYADAGIELRLNAMSPRSNPKASHVVLAGGDTVAYDRLFAGDRRRSGADGDPISRGGTAW
jgi:hypothetical protein